LHSGTGISGGQLENLSRVEHFFVSGGNSQVNAQADSAGLGDCRHEKAVFFKKALAFPDNRPRLKDTT
jgi:hypothetical protein